MAEENREEKSKKIPMIQVKISTKYIKSATPGSMPWEGSTLRYIKENFVRLSDRPVPESPLFLI